MLSHWDDDGLACFGLLGGNQFLRLLSLIVDVISACDDLAFAAVM